MSYLLLKALRINCGDLHSHIICIIFFLFMTRLPLLPMSGDTPEMYPAWKVSRRGLAAVIGTDLLLLAQVVEEVGCARIILRGCHLVEGGGGVDP